MHNFYKYFQLHTYTHFYVNSVNLFASVKVYLHTLPLLLSLLLTSISLILHEFNSFNVTSATYGIRQSERGDEN